MKKFYIISLLLCLFSIHSFAQNIGASFSSASFFSPIDGSYLETYMSIASNSVRWKQIENNKIQATVELTYIVKKDSNIITFTKEIVNSPAVDANGQPDEFFLNIQRITLPNGEYDLEILISDLNDTNRKTKTQTKVDIDVANEGVSISDIQCLDRYSKTIKPNILSKSGFDLIPYSFNIYPPEKEEFSFYTEIYNSEEVFGKKEPYLISYFIKNYETGNVLPQYKRFSRRTAKDIDPFLAKINIADLPSGNFEFVIEVRDKTNLEMAVKTYLFQRINPDADIEVSYINAININSTFVEKIEDIDSLIYCIRTMEPILGEREKVFAQSLIENRDAQSMQRYLYYFWSKKDQNNPKLEFLKYQAEVNIANETFGSTYNMGFETERGRVFLKYGPPNVRAKEYNDPGWLPYEIWHYYSTGNQRNIKFVFYSNDRSVADFNLLHSTALGEVSNYRWRMELRDTPSGGESIDDTGSDDSDWGNKLNDLWNNPR